jgi:hypothetical protein
MPDHTEKLHWDTLSLFCRSGCGLRESFITLVTGVVCIDDFDDGSQVYGPDIVCYLRHQEREFHNSIIKGLFFSNFYLQDLNLIFVTEHRQDSFMQM